MAIKLSFPSTHKPIMRLNRVTVRLIKEDEKNQWDKLVKEHHFLNSSRLAGNQLRYVAELYGKCVALLSFSASSYHLRLRDNWIGWSEEQLFQRRHFIVQNSRLLIMPDVTLKNLSSRVLSLCLKRLNADWQTHFGHPVLLVETFVDPAYHRGTCYNAANWIRLGETKGFKRSSRGYYESHGSPKALWIRPLRSDVQEILSSAQLPPHLAASEKELSSKYRLAKLPTESLNSLFDHLNTITDSRRRKGRRHNLASCLAVVACGTLAGCEGLTECAELAANLNQPQRQALRTRYNLNTRKYEVPSYSTLWRTIARTDPEEFEYVVKQWICQQHSKLPEAISIDGKALRATLDKNQKGHYVVSAVPHNLEKDFYFSQSMIECKTHEDEAARNIIASIPTLKGVTVTVDPLHNQKETANLIVDEKQGDFLFQVKKNTSKLYTFIENLFANPPVPPERAQQKNKGHGRHEKRTIEVLEIAPQQSGWPHTYKAAKLTREREIIRKGKVIDDQPETTYLVSSHKGNNINAKRLLDLSRGHWTIENKLHHKKDRSMDEDRYRARNGVARIMSCIRSVTTLIFGSSKKTQNVIQRKLSTKPHLLTQFIMCNSLIKWKLCFLN